MLGSKLHGVPDRVGRRLDSLLTGMLDPAQLSELLQRCGTTPESARADRTATSDDVAEHAPWCAFEAATDDASGDVLAHASDRAVSRARRRLPHAGDRAPHA